MGTPASRVRLIALSVAGAAFTGLVVYIVVQLAFPKVTVNADPEKPTYQIVPAEGDVQGERLELGPASFVLPPDWEYTEDSMEVDWDWEAGTATVMQTYFLAPVFNDDLSCSISVTPIEPAGSQDEWAAALMIEASALQQASDVSTDSAVGFADWRGASPMIYVTNTRTYSNGIPERYLAVVTVDSTNSWKVEMLIPGDDREPHEAPCFEILRSLKVS